MSALLNSIQGFTLLVRLRECRHGVPVSNYSRCLNNISGTYSGNVSLISRNIRVCSHFPEPYNYFPLSRRILSLFTNFRSIAMRRNADHVTSHIWLIVDREPLSGYFESFRAFYNQPRSKLNQTRHRSVRECSTQPDGRRPCTAAGVNVNGRY